MIDVEELMKAPEGTVRSGGDEFHDPDNWMWCRECKHENPADRDTCYNCGTRLERQ